MQTSDEHLRYQLLSSRGPVMSWQWCWNYKMRTLASTASTIATTDATTGTTTTTATTTTTTTAAAAAAATTTTTLATPTAFDARPAQAILRLGEGHFQVPLPCLF